LPEYFWQQVNGALANGPEGLVYFGIGLSLVAAVVFVFGMLGVAISRLKGESSIGRLIEAARGMTPVEREALWAEIARRRETGIRET
jgi:hypothetical protein